MIGLEAEAASCLEDSFGVCVLMVIGKAELRDDAKISKVAG